MNLCIDYRQTGPENVTADIAKAVQPQIWKDYLLILFFVLTTSVVTFAMK
jgi:hypothetical protein